LTDRDHYEQRACQSLVQHSGWREVVLKLVADQLTATERTASRTDLPESVRLGAVDQRQVLLWLLATIYKKADEMNPFDTARLALWSTLLPPREPAKVEGLRHESLHTPLDAAWRRSGGSVA
jgi:hypothetical protein